VVNPAVAVSKVLLTTRTPVQQRVVGRCWSYQNSQCNIC